MGTSVGAQAALGIGLVSAYGTEVMPTTFYPMVSEGLDRGQQFDVTKGMRSDAPRVRTASMVQLGKRDARGPVAIELNQKGAGKALKWALGAAASSQPDAGGNPTVYDHLFSPAASLAAQMNSVEVGWLDLAGSPFSKTLGS